MKFIKSMLILCIGIIAAYSASAQANAYINVLTLNSGQISQNGFGYVQVDVGNSGPNSNIGANKVRAQISIPSIATTLNVVQDSLPAGWVVVSNPGSAITICNGSDIITPNTVRRVKIKVKGVTVGGPSSVVGVLSFGPGTGVCTGPGSLPGDITTDNTSSSSITVTACNFTADTIVGPRQSCGYTTASGDVNATYTISAVSAASYVWTVPAGVVGLTGQGTNSISFRYPTNFTADSISVTVNGTCGSPVTRKIGVANNFSVGNAISGPSVICAYTTVVGGQTATYSIASTNASSIVWTVPATVVGLTGQGTNSISFKYPTTLTADSITVVVNGCGTSVTRKLLVVKKLAAPAAISGPLNVCPNLLTGTTYTATPVAGAVSYRWTLPTTVSIVSANTDSSVITVSFSSGFQAGTNKSIKVKAIAADACGNSVDKSITLATALPATPGVITGNNNACPYIGTDSVSFYRIRKIANTTNYIWTVPTGATIFSNPGGAGTANDTIIGVKFDNAFVTGTTISVVASSPCGNSAAKTLTINRTSSLVPGVISGPVNSCPLKVGTDNPSGTPTEYKIKTVKFATSYIWTVPSNAVILSPVASATTTIINDTTISTKDTAITVRFLSNYAGGNISVQSVTGCGSSAKKNLGVKDALLATPGTIVGTLNPCPTIGGPDTTTYRIKKVALATSYNWSVGAGGVIVSHPGGTGVNDTIVVISWSASSAYGPVTVTAQNNCRTSLVKSLVIMPLRPAIPGVITGITNPCNNIGSQVTYSVAALPANATSLLWTAPAGASIVGSATGLSVQVVYQSSFTTGAISVVGVNNCSNSAPKTLNIVRVAPATPGAITATVTSTVCATRAVTYSIASLPLNSSSVNWTAPAGGTITVLSATSISVAYPSTAVTGAVTATGVNGCGQTGAAKSLAVNLPACTVIGRTTAPAISKATSPIKAVIEPASMEAKVFPNPSTTSFKLQVLTTGKEKIQVRVMDIMGRAYKVLYMMPGEILNFGSELRTGTYMVEIIQGKNRTTQQVIKL